MEVDITDDSNHLTKIRFVAFIIPEFARTYKMNKQDAYRYLRKYGGLDFLLENWWDLHTDDPFWAVRELFEVCSQNGGDR